MSTQTRKTTNKRHRRELAARAPAGLRGPRAHGRAPRRRSQRFDGGRARGRHLDARQPRQGGLNGWRGGRGLSVCLCLLRRAREHLCAAVRRINALHGASSASHKHTALSLSLSLPTPPGARDPDRRGAVDRAADARRRGGLVGRRGGVTSTAPFQRGARGPRVTAPTAGLHAAPCRARALAAAAATAAPTAAAAAAFIYAIEATTFLHMKLLISVSLAPSSSAASSASYR